jgi:hypothetical protein
MRFLKQALRRLPHAFKVLRFGLCRFLRLRPIPCRGFSTTAGAGVNRELQNIRKSLQFSDYRSGEMADAQDLKIHLGPFQAVSCHRLSRALIHCDTMCYAIILAVSIVF